MQIIISGACGRMGRAVAAEAAAREVTVSCGIDPRGGEAAFPVYSDFSHITEKADCLVDFSAAGALDDILTYALATHTPCVLCATGYTEQQREAIRKASQHIPIFQSANMSLGIAVLRKLSRMAAEKLGEDFDIEIVEAHHYQKADAPSRTALLLFDAVKDAGSESKQRKDGRSGYGKREKNEIGMHALRGGTVAGEHTVCFFGPRERIELKHSAEDRSVFAVGALRAAAFLKDQEAGLYSMDDLLDV
ncbi:MAG: 4-hydroxy-tetrahydrodipicolinate reductase [Clostridia bacterium]|nr:4-hydroxy-tetrahydrodipicolinate reductase [Clostridia bacterium]